MCGVVCGGGGGVCVEGKWTGVVRWVSVFFGVELDSEAGEGGEDKMERGDGGGRHIKKPIQRQTSPNWRLDRTAPRHVQPECASRETEGLRQVQKAKLFTSKSQQIKALAEEHNSS